jgi:hypothetical protein
MPRRIIYTSKTPMIDLLIELNSDSDAVVLVSSDETADYLIKDWKIKPSRIQVYRPGVDL